MADAGADTESVNTETEAMAMSNPTARCYRRPCTCGETNNSIKSKTCKKCKVEFEKKKVQVKPVSAKQFSYHKSKLFQKATNLHAGQPNTHCVMMICHVTGRGNEFHLYGTEGIGRRFLSYQSDCAQKLFHVFCAANSKKRVTTAATLTTGHNDNTTTEQQSAIPIDAPTEHNETGPTQTGQNLTGPDPTVQDPTEQNLTGQNLTRPNLTGQNLTGPNLTGQNLTSPNPTGQNLTRPNLTEQNLTRPNLTEQSLTEQNLTGQNLTRPNLTVYLDINN